MIRSAHAVPGIIPKTETVSYQVWVGEGARLPQNEVDMRSPFARLPRDVCAIVVLVLLTACGRASPNLIQKCSAINDKTRIENAKKYVAGVILSDDLPLGMTRASKVELYDLDRKTLAENLKFHSFDENRARKSGSSIAFYDDVGSRRWIFVVFYDAKCTVSKMLADHMGR